MIDTYVCFPPIADVPFASQNVGMKRDGIIAAFLTATFVGCCMLILFASGQISRSPALTYLVLGLTTVSLLVGSVFVVRFVSRFVGNPLIRVVGKSDRAD